MRGPASVVSRALALLFALALGCAGAPPPPGAGERGVIRIAGSDTMTPLMRSWGEAFMRTRGGISVRVEGGGSRTGIEALIDARTDLCAASRAMQPDEVKRLLDRRGFLGLSILAAKDALSVYLHPENPVASLSLADLKGLFTGRIANWSAVGGDDLPVRLVNRQPNSGTYLFFRQHVLQEEPYNESARTARDTESVVEAVLADRGSVGYGGIAFGKTVRHVAVEGIDPTEENVRNGTYPLSRYLYLYAAGPLEGPMRAFVDWILSDEGQRVAAQAGYVSLYRLPEGDGGVLEVPEE